MMKPSEIIVAEYYDNNQKCLMEDVDDDAENVLERLLSSLSQQPDLLPIARRHQQTTLLQGEGGGNEASDFVEHIVRLLSGEELPSDGDDDEKKGTPEYEWGTALNFLSSMLIKKALTPWVICSTVLHASVFIMDDEESPKVTYTTVCLLLCCLALQECPITVFAKRKRRWKSVLFETIRMFQRHAFAFDDDDEQQLQYVVGTVFCPLWVKHVLPSLIRLRAGLAAAGNNDADDDRLSMAFVAGTVCTSCRLALALLHHQQQQQVQNEDDSSCSLYHHQTTTQQQMTELIVGLQKVVNDQYDTLIWAHPWRQRGATISRAALMECRRHPATQEDWLAYYTLRMESTTISEDDASYCEEERQEEVCYMETEWDSLGIAVLAAVGWESTRRLAWSSLYVWRLWFPHVSTLLLNNGTEGDQDDTVSFQQHLGYVLLDNLLSQIPSHSLSKPTLSSDPLSPIGTFQLLSNRIVVVAVESSQHDLRKTCRDATLPNATQTFQLMKVLLAKYNPMDQVMLIKELVRDCPHDGLQPKLLDLLRSFVSWNDSDAEALVWEYIESFVADLETHVEVRTKGNAMLKNTEALVQNGEMFGSALGLIQRWVMLKRMMIPDVSNLKPRLELLHEAMTNTLRRWSTDSMATPPDEYFRLNLLEDCLSKTLSSIKELESSLQE